MKAVLHDCVRISNRVMLMLNPGDPDQRALESLVIEISTEFTRGAAYEPRKITALMDRIIPAARRVFRSEWERAMKGI